MPTPNPVLARQVLENIEANPNEWQQQSWACRFLGSETSCDSAFCYAGHAVRMAHPDAEFQFFESDVLREEATAVEIPGVGRQSIRILAQQLLGLDDYSADVLFYADNTLEDLRDYVSQLERPNFSGELACVNPRFGNDDEADEADDYYYDEVNY